MTGPSARRLRLEVRIERHPLKAPFRITGYTFSHLDLLVVTLADGMHEVRGEAGGVYYRGDVAASMAAQIEGVRDQIETGLGRVSLQQLLPKGGARNAVDCALWDLESKQTGRAVWDLAALSAPRPLLTTYTLGADGAAAMADQALAYRDARALKLKLTGEPLDNDRVLAVRAVRPDVWMAVDANQGFTQESLARLMPTLVAADVRLIEQPFPLDRDAWLDGFESPIPIAADESVQGFEDIAALAGRVQVINIKLDKCGGLTEALAMAREIDRLGMKVMVGNMFGSGLAMAPAFVLGQLCDVVDLDGPLTLQTDRDPPTRYQDGCVWCPPEIWGNPVSTPYPVVEA